MPNRKTDPGAGIARVIVRTVTEAVVKARAGILPAEQAEKWRHTNAWLESGESEMKEILAPLFSRLAGDDTLPDEWRALFDEMGSPVHQWGFLWELIGVLGAVIAAIPQFGAIDIRSRVQQLNAELPNVPLSPADLADGIVRGRWDAGWAGPQAALSGVGGDNFAAMVDLVGMPIGIEEMVALNRRGAMTDEELQTGLMFSRIANEYIPFAIENGYSYMSPADVIELCVKGVLDPTDGQTMFQTAGGLVEQFDMLYLGAGDAIGTEQVLNLWNHGLATEADVDATLGRSRINPVFYPLAKELRNHWLSEYQIMQALSAGGCTAEQASQWLAQLGLPADQIAAFVTYGTRTQATKVHAETEAMVSELYTEQVITAEQATGQLVALGYQPEVATMIIELADAKRAMSQRNAAISAVRAAALSGKITAAQASNDLDALGISAAARDQWLTAWAIDASTRVKELTTAQVGDMAKKGVFGSDQAIAIWTGQGYSGAAAILLAAYYGATPAPDPTDVANAAAQVASAGQNGWVPVTPQPGQ